jgi:hypothetical protein
MESVIKELLGINETDTSKDPVISQIITLVSGRLNTRLGTKEVPEELQYIVIEVSIARFNRIGNEGMSSYSQTEENISFSGMFAEFEDDIATWKDKQGNGIAQKGGFKFL